MWIKCQNKRMINTDFFREINTATEKAPLNEEEKNAKTEVERIFRDGASIGTRIKSYKEEKYSGLRVQIFACKDWCLSQKTYEAKYIILDYTGNKEIAKKILNTAYKHIWKNIGRDGLSIDIEEIIKYFDENFTEE